MEDDAADLVRPEVVQERPKPWGFWATAGLSLVVIGVFAAVQIAVTFGFAVAEMLTHRQLTPQQLAERLGTNGLLLALATCASAPCGIALTVLFAKLRAELPLAEYLALRPAPARQWLKWLVLLLMLLAGSDALSYALGRPIVPEFMVEVYRSAVLPPLLWLALMVAAPLFEEIFFRGFMFEGILRSRLGGPGAILITSLVFAAMHLQYDVYGIASIFVMGLVLGIARLQSGSVYLTIVMHAMANAIATVEVVVYLNR